MARGVIYDYMKLQHDRADLVDGSDEILPEDERVTEARYRDPAYGAFRRAQAAYPEIAERVPPNPDANDTDPPAEVPRDPRRPG